MARLLPSLAMLAVATGAAAVVDLFRNPPIERTVTLTEGATAVVLALFALATTFARKSIVALITIACAGTIALVLGWGIVTSITGGIASPYALAVPLGLTVMLLTVPFPPWNVPVLALASAIVLALVAPSAPPSAYVMFLLLGAGGFTIARTRRRRALLHFRRVERLANAALRIRRVQEQLVMVEKLEALRVLVGGIAHELNNALAISLASLEQVTKAVDTDPAAALRAANRAQGGLVRIRSTVDKLRRFAMAEEGVLEPADVCAMLDFALESAIGRARSGVAIDRQYDANLPAVETHVAALAEALFQVAKNAVESMPKGGTIRASVRNEGDRVVIAVADEGKGIPPARLAKVFDPYYARDSDTTYGSGRILAPLPGRSGMGLSAVYGLVSALGGKVDIRSEVGKGTEVAIVLPARASRRPPPSRPR